MASNIARLTPKQSSQLESLAITINAEWENANSLAKQALEKYIMVGTHLLEARSMFPGDKEFGQWANEQLPEIQKRWRSSLMSVARKFAPILSEEDSSGQPAARNLLTMLPVSTLNELVPASDETIERVVARLRNGEKVTKLDARDMVKDQSPVVHPGPVPSAGPSVAAVTHVSPVVALEPSGSGGGGGSAPEADGEPPVAQQSKVVLDVPSVEVRTLSLLLLPIERRLAMSDDPFIVFGLNPFTDVPFVNEDVLEILYRTFNEYLTELPVPKKKIEKLNRCYSDIKSIIDMESNANGLGLVCHRVCEGYYD